MATPTTAPNAAAVPETRRSALARATLAARPRPYRPVADTATGITLAPLLAAIRAEIADTATPDLSIRQIGVLALLDLEPLERRHIRTLAATLGIQKPVITRALDRLEELLFATRLRATPDRRDVQGAITPQGRAWLRRFAGAAAGAPQ